ncbi:dCTP deaminase [Patescibacteria group bacterium]
MTKNKILEEIGNKRIKISPFNPSSVGPGSVDFHLGKDFRVFRQAKSLFHVTDEMDISDVTKLIKIDDHLTLLPGQSVHGITIETLSLPGDICGWIQGRSVLARIGLLVHITANFIHPGTNSKLVLEMTNAGPMPLAIHPGIAICQIIFEETKGEAVYSGRYSKQQNP